MIGIKKLIFQLEKWLENENKKNQTMIQENQKKQKSEIIYEFMLDMQLDLFECFRHSSFGGGLVPISSPQIIRIFDFKQTPKGILYLFRIPKTRIDRIPSVVCDQIKKNMNADVASTSRRIMYQMGWDWLYCTHPYLAKGIYIVDVQDLGDGDLVISVATHIVPRI